MARTLSFKKSLIAGALASAALAFATLAPSEPARAQWTVFDPSNYSQNILTAARTLEQINNQVRMLQNQAQSLANQAKNLGRISFPELQALQQTMQQIDQLMGQAQGIQFKVASLDQQFRSLYPDSFAQSMTTSQQVQSALTRMDTARAAFAQTMTVQAQVVENIAADQAALTGIVARSQGAEGALQASQATNQLLALVAKQQFQIQTLMAAQYRAEAIERANQAQSRSDAQTAATKFLGSGRAYTPH